MITTRRIGGSRLASRAAAVLKITGTPATEFLLIPFGRVEVDQALRGGSFTFTRRHAQSIMRWFESLGRSLAIDYEHQSMKNLNWRPDALVPAAGWIGGLEIRADGLWATRIEWTESARDLIASGQYRYFSPVIYWSDEKCTDVRSLGPVALTNDPALRQIAPLVATRIAASRIMVAQPKDKPGAGADAGRDIGLRPVTQGVYQKGGPQMDQIAVALGLEPGANMQEILEAIVALKAQAQGGAGAGAGGGEEGRWRSEYRRSLPLQDEFGDEKVYVAFKKADHAGLVRIFNR